MSLRSTSPRQPAATYPFESMLSPDEMTMISALTDQLYDLLSESSRSSKLARAHRADIDALTDQIDAIAAAVWVREMRIPPGSIVGVERNGYIDAIALDSIAIVVMPSQPAQWCLTGRCIRKDGRVGKRRSFLFYLEHEVLKHRGPDGAWSDVPPWTAQANNATCGTAAGPVVIAPSGPRSTP